MDKLNPNITTTILSISVDVLVSFEKVSIPDGEQLTIKTFELINYSDIKKEVESELDNYHTNPENYVTNFNWEI
jgi:ribosome recycling factor